MKKKSIIIIIIVLFILLFPLRLQRKDGGTVDYAAVLYGVTKMHAYHHEGEQLGLNVGVQIRILWFQVYDNVRFVPLDAE